MRTAHIDGSPCAVHHEVTNKHTCVPLRPAAPRTSDISFLCLGGKEGGVGKKTVCCHGNNKLLLGEKCGGAAVLSSGRGGGLSKDRVNCLDINMRTHMLFHAHRHTHTRAVR